MNIKNLLLLLRYPKILFRSFSARHDSKYNAEWDHALSVLLDADVPIRVVSSEKAMMGKTTLYIGHIAEAGEAIITGGFTGCVSMLTAVRLWHRVKYCRKQYEHEQAERRKKEYLEQTLGEDLSCFLVFND